MSPPESNEPPAPRGPRESGAQPEGRQDLCARIQNKILAFVSVGGSPSQHRRLREHLQECADCRTSYREAIATAARMGHGMREARETEGRRRRKSEKRKVIFAAGSPRRRFGLQSVLIPAMLIVLLTHALVRPEPTFDVAWLAGVARVGENYLSASEPLLEAARGEWVVTEDNARATVEAADLTVELGPDTRLMLDDPRTGRVLLRRGSLMLEGEGLVTTFVGVLESFEGVWELELVEGELRLTCHEGRGDFLDATGVYPVAGGQELRAGGGAPRVVSF